MRAIIVGASSGIGFETAQLLIRKGSSVINISRSPAPKAETIYLAKSAPTLNADALAYEMENIYADASLSGSLKQAITKAGKSGAIDTLIYSAGYSMASPVEHAQESDYRYLFDVNLFGAIEAAAAVIPFMKAGGGRIIFLSSMAATFPIVFDSFYSSSKAAVDMLSLSLNMELKPYNIFVTSVKPGGVSTRFTYKRNVYDDSKVYGYALKQRKAVATLNKEEQTGMSPTEVADYIYSLLLKPSPPPIATCGLKNRSRLFAQRFMPKKTLLNMTISKYNQ